MGEKSVIPAKKREPVERGASSSRFIVGIADEKWVFLNGVFCLEKEAFIPVTDRGFLFGDGIFTTMRLHNGKCEFFSGHLQRLQTQAKALHFNWNFPSFDFIAELIDRNQAQKETWRLKIMITVHEVGGKREAGCLLATMERIQDLSFSPCMLCLFPYPIESPLAHVKSLSYLEHIYVRDYAQKRGFADAITQTAEGRLLETGCSNLFWIDEGKCWIPDTQLPYLNGIFLQSILPYLNIPIELIKATMNQVPSGANVYICNSLTHIRPVTAIDQVSFPRSKDTENLLKETVVRALHGNQ